MFNMEELRERIQGDIRTKMEKLCKLRERHPVFQYGKRLDDSLMYSMKRTINELDVSAVSSTHEHVETQYYVVDE